MKHCTMTDFFWYKFIFSFINHKLDHAKEYQDRSRLRMVSKGHLTEAREQNSN